MKLHRKKRINAIFTLYSRYRLYGYSIVNFQLKKCGLLNSLGDERDSIVYDAVDEAIEAFDENKGSFKSLLSKIIINITLKYVNKFSRDPLSDYISLDEERKIGDELVFMDSSINNISNEKEIMFNTEIDFIKDNYNGRYQRRIKRMVEMKRDGFTYKEIAVRYQTTEKAVRAIFYRLKIRMNKIK